MKEYPQGSTIRFLIKFKDDNTSPTITSFDDLTNILLLAYTEKL